MELEIVDEVIIELNKKFKVGSLFAGIGGVCLGFDQAQYKESGYELVWANEIDSYACETYRNNFEHDLLEGDILYILNPDKVNDKIEELEKEIKNLTKVIEENSDKKITKKLKSLKNELEELKGDKGYSYYKELNEKILNQKIDVLTGGFPCQAFSIAGEQKGFEDERGNLFLSFIHLVNDLNKKFEKPRLLFLENVKNLHAHDQGNTYKVIKSELEKTGYIIRDFILNTMEYSELPQNRERIYIIGFLNEADCKKFDESVDIKKLKKSKTSEQKKESVSRIIDYLSTGNELEKYYYTRNKFPHYFMTDEEFNSTDGSDTKNKINLTEQITEKNQFYQLRRGMYVRKNKSDVCPTLTANMGTGGHNVPLVLVNDGIRKITPEEAFRIQGFPIDNGYKLPKKYNGRAYPDSQLYKQAGNAVSVPVVSMLAEELLKILDDEC